MEPVHVQDITDEPAREDEAQACLGDSPHLRVAWVSVDPKSGEPAVYPRAAAELLEVGWCHGLTSVSLSSFSEPEWLSEATVDLHAAEPMQRTGRSGCRDVRRVELIGGEASARLHVVEAVLSAGPSAPRWRISDFPVTGVTQERSVAVPERETVAPRRPRGGPPKTVPSRPLKPAPLIASLAPTLRKLAVDAGQAGGTHATQRARVSKFSRETSARAVAAEHGHAVSE